MNHCCAVSLGTTAYKTYIRCLSALSALSLLLSLSACAGPASLSRGANVSETGAVSGLAAPEGASFVTALPPGSFMDETSDEKEAFPLSIRVEEFIDNRLSEDGTVTLVEGAWPCIYLETEGYEALNASLTQYNEALQKSAVSEIDSYERFALDCIGNGLWESLSSLAYDCTMDVVRADDQYVSLLTYYYSYTGGVHPNYWYDGITFDSQTGKVLSVTDFMPDPSRLAELLETKLLDTYDREWFLYDDLSAVILSDYSKSNHLSFTTGEEGLTFYFSPYDLGCYAAGAQVITLNWKELS